MVASCSNASSRSRRLSPDLDKIDTWEEASCGWASAKGNLEWAGVSHDARLTCVLHLENDEWKVVQAHMSLATANESIGMTLTTTLEELEQAIARERPDISAWFADGTVTIVFTDIVDSTLMLSRLGDALGSMSYSATMPWSRRSPTRTAARSLRRRATGSMLAFSSARRAVACAQATQDAMERAFADFSPPIRVRVGIHTGDAIK